MHSTPSHGLSLVASVGLRQDRSFATSYLSITSGWGQRHLRDLESLVRSEPTTWPLEDRLLAKFLPDMRASVFAFHHGNGPDLHQLFRNPEVIERLDGELVGKLHDALSQLWIERSTPPRQSRTPSARRSREAVREAHSGDPIPDVIVALARGVPLVSLAPNRRARWGPDRCNQAIALCTTLFTHQVRFLESGRAEIRPYSLRALAEQAGVHESTASRVLAGAIAATPHGMIPLRELFASGVRTVDDDEVSSRAVKEMLLAMLKGDAPDQAQTDDDLVARLKARGVVVARRTVAKYRAQLGLASGATRRRAATPVAPIQSSTVPATDKYQ